MQLVKKILYSFLFLSICEKALATEEWTELEIQEESVSPDNTTGTTKKSKCKNYGSGDCNSGALCFNIESLVVTPSGEKTLRDVLPGDKVLTVSNEGNLEYEPVIVDLHLMPELETWFYKITAGEKSLMLTPQHYIYVGNNLEASKLVSAEKVKVGDSVLIITADGIKVLAVEKVELLKSVGISNPLLPSGNIVVEGMLASAYSGLFQPLSVCQQHGSLWMVRQIYILVPNVIRSAVSNKLPVLEPFMAMFHNFMGAMKEQ